MKIPQNSTLFIDSNVIVDYLILSVLKKDKIKEISHNIKTSHELVKKLLDKKYFKNVYTSRLVILEMFSAVVDTYLSKKMFLDNVSLRYFRKLKGIDYSLKTDDINDIISLIKEFEEDSKGKIEILDLQIDNSIQARSSQFIFHYFSPVDAIHLAIAKINGAKYFVTRDRDFLENKQLIKNITKTTILHPKDIEL